MRSIQRLLPLLGLCLLISSCGFALRGSERPALNADAVYLSSAQLNSPLSQSILSALRAQQIAVVEDPAQSAYQLLVGPEEFSSRTATVNGRARAAQNRYLLSAEVSLEQGQQVLLPPERIIVENELFFDSFNTDGSLREEELVRQEMREQFARQLMNRLRAVAGQ